MIKILVLIILGIVPSLYAEDLNSDQIIFDLMDDLQRLLVLRLKFLKNWLL